MTTIPHKVTVHLTHDLRHLVGMAMQVRGEGARASVVVQDLLEELRYVLREGDPSVAPLFGHADFGRHRVLRQMADEVMPMLLACASGDIERVRYVLNLFARDLGQERYLLDVAGSMMLAYHDKRSLLALHSSHEQGHDGVCDNEDDDDF
jgi:hypothetical protein